MKNSTTLRCLSKVRMAIIGRTKIANVSTDVNEWKFLRTAGGNADQYSHWENSMEMYHSKNSTATKTSYLTT